jgi:hypothetical protein
VAPPGTQDPEDESIGPPEAQVGSSPSVSNQPSGTRNAAGQPDDDADWVGPTRRERPAATIVIALVAVSAIALALLWSAGEAHYRNCLEAAYLKTQGATDSLSKLVRQRAVENCSRSPF